MAKKEETKLENGNLRFYEQLRSVPEGAIKKIGAGRLSGMSNINPVWRTQVMTETFGPCGIGWKYEIVKQWLEPFSYPVTRMKQENGQYVTTTEQVTEIKAFCNINLYIKVDGQWSDAIPGTGGSSFVAQESKGPYVSDEALKMSLTDALSVAMKSLGVAADIYFAEGVNLVETKYEQQSMQQPPQMDMTRWQQAQKEIGAAKTRAKLSELNNSYQDLWNYQPYMDAINNKFLSLPQ